MPVTAIRNDLLDPLQNYAVHFCSFVPMTSRLSGALVGVGVVSVCVVVSVGVAGGVGPPFSGDPSRSPSSRRTIEGNTADRESPIVVSSARVRVQIDRRPY